MTFSLRLLAHSRRLRVMGVLTWLMLVVNSLVAAPPGMAGMLRSHSAHAAVAAGPEAGHHDVSMTGSRPCGDTASSGCSGMTTGHACHCAATCNGTLPPAEAVAFAAVSITNRYAMPLATRAPSLRATPPLRPPTL